METTLWIDITMKATLRIVISLKATLGIVKVTIVSKANMLRIF